MALRRWHELASETLAACDRAATVAVLPLAATEQHGPHLPLGTDFFIAEGMLAATAERVPAEVPVLVMPTMPVGASAEHGRFAGTLSLPAAALIEAIAAIAAGVAASGLSKLAIVTAHGGNVAAMTAAALECRTRHGLVAVATSFARLGVPPDFVDERELETGIHGGLVETALMLHFRPELVEMGKAADFASRQSELARRHRHLRVHGPIGYGWLADDLNPQGVVGNAAAATPEIGAAIARHRAERLAELLAEISGAPLDSLLSRP
ncbi:MAG TPA: creatininase family protein [Afifellaceae bacterium]|nr:creatininase family protein [Afifellaceae bacterium]